MKQIVEVAIMKKCGGYDQYAANFYVEMTAEVKRSLDNLTARLTELFKTHDQSDVSYLENSINKHKKMVEILSKLTDEDREILNNAVSIEGLERDIGYLNESLEEQKASKTTFYWRSEKSSKPLFEKYDDMMSFCIEEVMPNEEE